jgi:predicted DCC family thiol-disulfide oxidoreductase YuxK
LRVFPEGGRYKVHWLAVNLSALRQALTRTYLTIDPRSLGLCRIVLGVVLIIDLARRVPYVRAFYTNDGLLPNHTVLWRPPLPRLFSVFFPVSLMHEAVLVFIICFLCFFFLMIGWRTRLFHLLSFAMTTSLHNRVLFAENWGAVALGALMVWTAFLPLGRRFSVDAVLSSMRAHAGETPDDLGPARVGEQTAPDNRPVVSLAVLGILLQLAAIYWFNFVHKSGATWKTGTAVHYVLWQERIVTVLGLWVRTHLPFAFTKALTHGTLLAESAAPFLILTPIFWRWTRPLAAVVLAGLHIGIALFVNLGIFSGAMVAFFPLLLDTSTWQAMNRLVPRRGRRRTVFYDAGCGVCFWTTRVIARLDVHRRLTWISNADRAALPEGVDPELLEKTILVIDYDGDPDRVPKPPRDGALQAEPAGSPRERGRRWTRAAAFAEIFGTLPFGRFWAWPLRVPGLGALANLAYDAFARNRTTISTWLGLAACGIPGAPAPVRSKPQPIPLVTWLRGRLPLLREAGVAMVMLVFWSDLSIANAAMPEALRWRSRPAWFEPAVMYPHIFQGWSMFSPEAPLSDEMVVIDAVTRDGRHVDPLNELGSRVASLPVTGQIPPRLGHVSLICDYTLRIPEAGSYFQALIEWVLRYPQRTGRKGDEIVSFEAWKVEQTSPPPGGQQPTDFRRHLFLRWPEPGRR